MLIVDKGHTAGLADLGLLGVVNGEHDGHGHIDKGAIVETERVEIKNLEELVFSHVASQLAGPAFSEHVQPLEVDLGELDSGQTHGLILLSLSLIPRRKAPRASRRRVVSAHMKLGSRVGPYTRPW